MTWLKRIITDPLTHFLIIGVAILLVASLLDREGNQSDADRQISVDREALLTFMQYRANSFDPETSDTYLTEMSEADRKELVSDYVRNEVLLREAVALGLDRSDGVIRGRLQQRMEFALKGLIAETGPQSDEAITTYFQENIEAYRIAPSITFTHIFFSTKSDAPFEAEERAAKALETMDSTPNANPNPLGDRFQYFGNYVERTPELVASHFGDDFTTTVFAINPEPGLWQGPVLSPYGLHLVQVSGKRASRLPQFEEVQSQVTEDATRASTDQRLEKAIRELTAGYQVTVDLSKTESE